MYKKARCTCKPVVLLIKPIVFFTFSLPSASLDLKVPLSILTWASLLQLIGLLVVEGVVETTMDLFVGGSLSSFSFVKIVLYNLSWNSFANIAACFSGLSVTSVLLSQSQVMLLLQVPVSKIQDIKRNKNWMRKILNL